ncbi:MAG: hypothetical protein JSS95_12990 [Acidobacteria bacterium]|nr:hypothetical protein [Acidobacteriota bacterium]
MSNQLDPAKKNSIAREGTPLVTTRSLMRNLRIALTAISLLGFASLVPAQTAAPLPAQLSKAKTIFLANAGSNAVPFLKGYPDQSYNALYQALVSSNRFQIVTTPADADLLCEFSMNGIVGPASGGDSWGIAFFQLVIRDPKTQALLWTISENVGPTIREKNFKKNVTEAATKLAGDLKELASRNPAVVTIPQEQEPPQKTRFSQKEK